MATTNEVMIPLGIKHEYYKLGGHDNTWWKKIKKQAAKDDNFARQAIYGDKSLGWFTPVKSEPKQDES